MEEVTESEYRQEMRNYFKCTILDTKCIYNDCNACTTGIAFRKGIEWERTLDKWGL